MDLWSSLRRTPSFNSNNPVFVHEKEDRDGVVSDRYGVKIYGYLDVPAVKGSGAPGEPLPHTYYHRPLQELLAAAFKAGIRTGRAVGADL